MWGKYTYQQIQHNAQSENILISAKQTNACLPVCLIGVSRVTHEDGEAT